MTPKQIASLLKKGDLVRSQICGELSSFSWQYVTERDCYYRLGYNPGEIAIVDSASCFEWSCGHCGAHHVKKSAPILTEAYTHVDPKASRGRAPA